MNLRVVENAGNRALIALSALALAVLLSASAAHRPPQALAATPSAAQLTLQLDPAHSTLHYTVDTTLHTVHGTFALKNGSIRVDPVSATAGGEIVADAASGQSGNNSRDQKMHREVLESARYTAIIFRPDRLDGALHPQGSSTLRVHGIFLLHGSEHELTVPVDANLTGTQWTATSKFAIPYVSWGLKNPSNFLLKVNPAVNIDLEMSGAIQNAPDSK